MARKLVILLTDMPELPEVETIRRYLQQKIVNKTITKINVLDKSQFHGDQKDVVNNRIVAVERLGKVLAIKLEDKTYLNFHFKLSGQILYSNNAENAIFKNTIPLSSTNRMPGRSTRVIFYFDDGSGLFFNEMRKFGWVKYSPKIEGPKGVDILTSEFTLDYFKKNLQNTRRPVKVVLMDQDRFAGVGNIYANEALFDAKINPEISANNLTIEQLNHLYKSIIKVIKHGIKYHGSSGRDEVYILSDGSKGEYQYHFLVYQQEGKRCQRCGEVIMRIKQGGRSSFYCPECQKMLPKDELLF
ncbi:DNA-formamidopyrimidine glycosylase [Candidatus Roizmanbacteria bacterium RIFCSPHIGHO2_01_FULL_39_12b]|uniref:DNA-formamidopyrimidine glycosylase n=1 Tax=Candidatus Roizmanbacteria bacterium RIFCSPHIGHO2_01_FULL_39_12b TaxID=1802030 RepID=A0A1F7GC54_9BACT|nr:MAG: DNA-formamidopyrimidine glycosylase [Candidatus Roizmanbacteria bacterium RIFCSPHIGHO2_01_FULL_39_12b]OGK47150.1 MAG: DNA-formamidopyrimidine glycosylase [Candidatus Roizmanbacteria bacterium RIFCSPLOWO2_01_FULL_39_19]